MELIEKSRYKSVTYGFKKLHFPSVKIVFHDKKLSVTAFSIITHRYKIEYGNHNSRFIQWVIYELQVNFYLGVVRTTQVLYKELVSSTGLKLSFESGSWIFPTLF